MPEGEGPSGKGRSFLFRLGNFLNFKCAPLARYGFNVQRAEGMAARGGHKVGRETRLGFGLVSWSFDYESAATICPLLSHSPLHVQQQRGNNTNSAACKFDCSCSRAKKTTRQGSGKEVESKRELVRAAGVGAGIQ